MYIYVDCETIQIRIDINQINQSIIYTKLTTRVVTISCFSGVVLLSWSSLINVIFNYRLNFSKLVYIISHSSNKFTEIMCLLVYYCIKNQVI